MKSGINLLKTGKELPDASNYQHLVRVGGTILIIIYLLVVLVVFSIYFFISNREKKVLGKIDQITQEIKTREKIETLQQTLKNRSEGLSLILAKDEGKIGISESLKRIRDSTGTRVMINSMEIDQSGNKVTLRATTENIVDLIEFFNQLLAIKGDKGGFDNIFLSSLNQSNIGYQFSLSLEISS